MSKLPEETYYIYDAQFLQEHVPPGFNAVRLPLDAQIRSTMDWKKGIEAAAKFRDQGMKILWDLKLGLFSDLTLPLTNDMQFKSLCLGIEHFVMNVWKDFEHSTIGVSLYRGPLNFGKKFPWDPLQTDHWIKWLQDGFETVNILNQELGLQLSSFQDCDPLAVPSLSSLFCQDVGGGYLNLLTQKLPDKLQPFLCLDGSSEVDPLFQARLLMADRFEHMTTIVKGSLIPLPHMTWETKVPSIGMLSRFPYPIIPQPEATYGICLPPATARRPSQYTGLSEAIKDLEDKRIAYKIIPEEKLTSEWAGLDYLIVNQSSITPQGQRKLNGFIAAGGKVIPA